MQRAKTAEQRQEYLDAYRASGLTVRQWCKKTGLSSTTMYRWLQQQAKATETEQSIVEETKSQSQSVSTVSWLPVTKKGESSNVTSEHSQIQLKENMVVEKLEVQIGRFTIIAPNGFGRGAFKSVCEILLEIC